MLHVLHVSPSDAGFYTCRMTFNLTGVISEVAETIVCEVIGEKQTKTVSDIHKELQLVTQLNLWLRIN